MRQLAYGTMPIKMQTTTETIRESYSTHWVISRCLDYRSGGKKVLLSVFMSFEPSRWRGRSETRESIATW